MKTSLLWRVVAWCVLALAFGMAVYRAKTQTIAHDEALEYEWFLDGGVYHVLAYNTANHVLFTLLAKPIVWALGVTEFKLRAPSLFGTGLYLIVTFLLCKRLFGDGILLFLSVAMLCLNPQVLEFMPAARGYILGLASLAAAIYAMARMADRGVFNPEEKESRWGCAIASAFLALSVAANFTNIVPAAALALSFSAVAMGGLPALWKFSDRKLRSFARYFLVPGAVTGFCLLWPYLIQARLSQTKIPLNKGSDAIRDVFAASFLYRWTDEVFASLGGVAASPGSWQERVTDFGMYGFFPWLFFFVATGLILALRSRRGSESKQSAQCLVFCGAALASLILIVFFHVTTKVNYPYARYCLFLIPLFTLGSLLAGREISHRYPRPYLKGIGLLMAAVVVSDYALSLQTRYFRYNAYDVISRDLYLAIANDAQSRRLTNVRVGGTWWYEPEINFYRRRYNAKWMMEYDIKDRSYWWQTPNSLTSADYDYFVYRPEGDPGLDGPRVRMIYRDQVRGITVVANPR